MDSQLHCLRQLVWCDLHHRASIHLPGVEKIVGDSKDHNSARHETAEIHMRSIRVDHCRKEAEDENDDAVTDREGIEEDAPNTRDVKGAPDQFVGMPCCTGHLVRVTNGASDAMPQEHGFGDDVGCVEAADADGDNVVEGCRGTNVDQADGARYARHDHDCVQWDSGVFLDL